MYIYVILLLSVYKKITQKHVLVAKLKIQFALDRIFKQQTHSIKRTLRLMLYTSLGL